MGRDEDKTMATGWPWRRDDANKRNKMGWQKYNLYYGKMGWLQDNLEDGQMTKTGGIYVRFVEMNGGCWALSYENRIRTGRH